MWSTTNVVDNQLGRQQMMKLMMAWGMRSVDRRTDDGMDDESDDEVGSSMSGMYLWICLRKG